MQLDDALNSLGSVGRWQVTYFLCLSVAVMFPAGWHMVSLVYIGYKPEHHCKIPSGATVNDSIPWVDNKLSSCHMYDENYNSVPCTDGWTYKGDDGPTIITDWNLVCEKDHLSHVTQTILVMGVMFGAMFFTSLSDRLGRKPIFFISQWGMIIVGVATAFSPNFYFFCFLRFFTGAFQQGIILTGFVLACELFASKHRTFAGTIIENFWAVAWSVFPLLAYLFKNWVHLQLFISLFGLLTVPLYWFLPESLPWLIANGRTKEAEKTIQDAAKMNKITIPDPVLDHNDLELQDQPTKTSIKESIMKLLKKDKERETKAQYTIFDLLKSKRLMAYVFIMSLLWMVVTLVYYGLTLSTAQLAGNRYVNGFLNAVVEIPAYTSSYFALKKYGRRYPLIGYQIIAGVGLLANAYLDRPELGYQESLMPLIIFFNMVGKFGITGSFGIVFLYAPEIFPTTLRNQALGIASLFGRIGNFLAPYASYISETQSWLPVAIYGTTSIVGGFLVLFLPETLNRPLPQTIEDIEAWSKKEDKVEEKEGGSTEEV